MNRVLFGPPASGKSTAALQQFRAVPDSYLVTPSTTMAEHIRHELARSGFPVRPSRVVTLAQWLDSPEPFAILAKPATEPMLHALIVEALERLRPPRFAAVREFRGFHKAVADLLEDAPAEALLDLEHVGRAVEEGLAACGCALRNARLRAAGAKIRSGNTAIPAQVIFDGFFTLSAAELELVKALAERTAVTITLPDCPSGESARLRLVSFGFRVERFLAARRAPQRLTFSAATPERESEEIARRILEHAARGRHFRDIGIVLRSRDPYSAVIETTLARFGIPARSYFASPLAFHPVIAYFSGIVNACLGGWDHAALTSLVRMPVSGEGATLAGDRLDFECRKNLPQKGLPFPLERFSVLEKWSEDRCDAITWAERLKHLRSMLPLPKVPEEADRDSIYVLRSTATALSAFDEALDQTAALFASGEKLALSRFWKQIETTLALEPLRVEDRRRDVVHVMDVYEARQWELPVVFVCGLLEREFPQYHREDPLLGDAARARLGLTTAAQKQAEERFLFELAVTRATEETVLSYSRFNEKGEETLPSFFLENADAPACDVRVRPAPKRAVASPLHRPITDSALLKQLAHSHRRLSPTGIESFLQCPFQFFAGKTLRLEERPPAPRDRLDLRRKGAILHQALAEWIAAPLLGSAVFNRVFDDECERERIPRSYRTEAVRLELLRHFEGFLKDSQMLLGWSVRSEEKFQFALNPLVTISGRIDRLECGPRNQALVIDYKYSAENKVRERVEDSEAGTLVQAGLYLMAVERALKLEPAGMLYCGLKKKVSWGGWHIPVPGLEHIGESRTPAALRELMNDAARRAEAAYEAIVSGNVPARPVNRDKCRWCDYRDACRIETIAESIAVGHTISSPVEAA